MAKKNLTEIVAIIDRSTSMGDVAGLPAEVIDSFNNFIAEQKKEAGDAFVTVALFSDQYELLIDGGLLSTMKEKTLTPENYVPSGMTSLHDAIGRTLSAVRDRHATLPEEEKPERVIVLIQTDGGENSSREYNATSVQKITDECTALGWEFIYLGAQAKDFSADQHLVQMRAMNMCPDMMANVNFVQASHTPKGQQESYAVATSAVSNYRSSGSTGLKK